jgi:hypothetical protein
MKVKEMMAKLAKEDPEEEIFTLEDGSWRYQITSVFKARFDNNGKITDDPTGKLILVVH